MTPETTAHLCGIRICLGSLTEIRSDIQSNEFFGHYPKRAPVFGGNSIASVNHTEDGLNCKCYVNKSARLCRSTMSSNDLQLDPMPVEAKPGLIYLQVYLWLEGF